MVDGFIGKLAMRAAFAAWDPVAGAHLADGPINCKYAQGGFPRLGGQATDGGPEGVVVEVIGEVG
jgi:hypothetical protein